MKDIFKSKIIAYRTLKILKIPYIAPKTHATYFCKTMGQGFNL